MFCRIRVALAGLLLCFLSFPSSPLSAVEGDSWVGKTVLTKTYNIKIEHTDNEDRQVHLASLKAIVYTVLKEQDPWIMVRERSVEGWALKENFVQLEDALVYFSERIRSDPRDAQAWVYRGTAWLQKGELDNAIKDMSEAIRLNPKYWAWYTNRSGAFARKEEYDRAIGDATEAIRLDPKRANGFVKRANAFWHQKEYDRAISDATMATRLDPQDPHAYNIRGIAYQDNKEYDKAIRDFDEAIRLNPKFAEAFYNKACYYALQGRTDPAIENLRQCVELGYRNFKHIEKDNDFDSIRGDMRYKELLEKYRK